MVKILNTEEEGTSHQDRDRIKIDCELCHKGILCHTFTVLVFEKKKIKKIIFHTY
jgi:hypothetical protein